MIDYLQHIFNFLFDKTSCQSQWVSFNNDGLGPVLEALLQLAAWLPWGCENTGTCLTASGSWLFPSSGKGVPKDV